jgi:hypothetical protein
MAVFFHTGGGDYYGGPTKEAVFEAIREDMGDEDFKEIEEEIEEVSGEMKMNASDENGDVTDETTTLAEEYEESLGAYCVASSNG